MSDKSALIKQTSWQTDNYNALLAEITSIKMALRNHLPDRVHKNDVVNEEPGTVIYPENTLSSGAVKTKGTVKKKDIPTNVSIMANVEKNKKINSDQQTSPMLDNLCEFFALSTFERQLLLLCVAMELDAEVPSLCMDIMQQSTPCMALALLCFDGHCCTMAPDAALVFFHLIEFKRDHISFVRRSLVISDWVLFYLTGAPIMDPLVSKIVQPIEPYEPVLPTQLKQVEALSRARQHISDKQTVVQLLSTSQDDQRQVAGLLAMRESRSIYEFSLYHVSLRGDEQDIMARFLLREVIARQCLILIDCQRLVAKGESKADSHVLRKWLASILFDIPNAFLLYAPEKVDLPQIKIHYQQLLGLPTDEQLQLWQYCLRENNTDVVQPTLETLTTHYNFTAAQVRSIARSAAIAHSSSTAGEMPTEHFQNKLWQYSREHSRQNLQGLATVIAPQDLDWNGLILPNKEKELLQSIVSQTSQRKLVYQTWGFAKQAPYGLGICALFSGVSGTGKTMAARIIASLLNLDLYHVDISKVVDKYIGETEKKLDTLFQAAENSGAVLLFDEADALFGKRTKVQDARDRYANSGVSFLLQRVESYAGLSILTTNQRSAIDSAFTRRLRFIVQFPFPGEQEREKIWRCMIPDSAPTINIEFTKLARLVLAGGAIRTIILQAAFMAAEHNQPITMQWLYHAVRQEYIKAEKTLDSNLVKDW